MPYETLPVKATLPATGKTRDWPPRGGAVTTGTGIGCPRGVAATHVPRVLGLRPAGRGRPPYAPLRGSWGRDGGVRWDAEHMGCEAASAFGAARLELVEDVSVSRHTFARS